MLKKNERLSRRQFDATYTTGRRLSSGALSIIIAPSLSGRCAVVVSKKIARHATQRNKVRRRVFAALAHLRPLWLNQNVIVLVRPAVATLSQDDLQGEIKTLLHKTESHR